MQTQIDKSKFNSIAESATMKIKFHFDCHVDAFSKRHANILHPCCIINKNFFLGILLKKFIRVMLSGRLDILCYFVVITSGEWN